jgi:glutamine amidotransferase
VCRWLAYSGTPILISDLIYKPKHSLIDQSLHARLGPCTTNGDGFGVGWYADGDSPVLYRAVDPIWNDWNLREISARIQSGLLFAHVRASMGTPVQQTNCHPFRYGKWLWMHNGSIAGFQQVKRELVLAVDPDLYPFIEGSTDTEVFFFLALTFGLHEDPPLAVERAVGFIERACRKHGVDDAVRMSVALSDGKLVWAFRYASRGEPPSLFYSTDVSTLREQHPEIPAFLTLSEETRLVVSEPLTDLAGGWNEVPASHYGVIEPGEDDLRRFTPRAE